MSIMDYILPSGGDKDRSTAQHSSELARIERETGEMPGSRDYTHWEGDRLVRTPLL